MSSGQKAWMEEEDSLGLPLRIPQPPVVPVVRNNYKVSVIIRGTNEATGGEWQFPVFAASMPDALAGVEKALLELGWTLAKTRSAFEQRNGDCFILRIEEISQVKTTAISSSTRR